MSQIVERDDGRVVAVEVKSSSQLGDRDLVGLRRVRDRAGDRFLAGFVLNTGRFAQRLDDRISVAPVATLWEP